MEHTNIEKKNFIIENRPFMELKSYRMSPDWQNIETMTEFNSYAESVIPEVKEICDEDVFLGFAVELHFVNKGKSPDRPFIGVQNPLQITDGEDFDYIFEPSEILFPMGKDGDEYTVTLRFICEKGDNDLDDPVDDFCKKVTGHEFTGLFNFLATNYFVNEEQEVVLSMICDDELHDAVCDNGPSPTYTICPEGSESRKPKM